MRAMQTEKLDEASSGVAIPVGGRVLTVLRHRNEESRRRARDAVERGPNNIRSQLSSVIEDELFVVRATAEARIANHTAVSGETRQIFKRVYRPAINSIPMYYSK